MYIYKIDHVSNFNSDISKVQGVLSTRDTDSYYYKVCGHRDLNSRSIPFAR